VETAAANRGRDSGSANTSAESDSLHRRGLPPLQVGTRLDCGQANGEQGSSTLQLTWFEGSNGLTPADRCQEGAAVKDAIRSVDAFTVALDLPRRLRLGDMEIARRAYAVVVITTDSGISGKAYALSRDAPVASTVRDQLAPVLLGQEADLVSARWEDCFRATIAAGRVGAVMRAISLVDIALWDIKGQRAGLPLWRLLGGYMPDVEMMLVAGYPTGDQPEVLGAKIGEYGREGNRLLKVARVPDPEEMRRLLDSAAAQLPDGCELVVDAAWAWRQAGDVAREVRSWGDTRLAWLEDPLPPENVRAYSRLRRALPTSIGVGDEVTDPYVFERLVAEDAIDVVRLDVNTIGGITGAARVWHLANAAGLPVSYHVYPEVHVHLAAASSQRAIVESFDWRANPFDPANRFIEGGPAYRPGVVTATEEPGLGFELDRDVLKRHRVDA
jgi:L-alanine-DL-glutamate epimerase-like enolase superfamily enzyme